MSFPPEFNTLKGKLLQSKRDSSDKLLAQPGFSDLGRSYDEGKEVDENSRYRRVETAIR
jgi:hypothetical protein